MRLYDLSEQYNVLAEMLEQDADNEALKTMLDGTGDAFDAKAESIAKLMKSKIAEHDTVMAESKRLAERAAKMAKEIDWLENYLETEMIRTGKDKVRSNLFSISIVKCPPSVNVLNEAEVPEVYIKAKVVTSIDKQSILERLKAGDEIPGVQLAQRQTLKIK